MIKIRTMKDIQTLKEHLVTNGCLFGMRQEKGRGCVISELDIEVTSEEDIGRVKTALACELIRRTGSWGWVGEGYGPAGLVESYVQEVEIRLDETIDIDTMERRIFG